jgi:hypothetical protein
MKILQNSSGHTIAKAAWKSFDEAFQESVEQLRRYRELLEDEARLAIMVEQIQEREKAEAERRSAAESRNKVEYLESILTKQEKSRLISDCVRSDH